MSLTHYGTMFSYYSAKTRAYLCYRRIPFVEVYDAQALGGRIREQIGKLVIPVVETAEGEILQDTTVIIDTLEPQYVERPTFPHDEVLMLVTRIVEFIIDEFWLTTAMHSRWNDPQSNLFAATEFGLGIGGSMGLVGDDALNMGLKVAARMQSYLPRLGIADEAGQKAVSDYFESCSKVLNTAVDARQFLFGKRPSLIDFCVFTGYYAHQYRDAGDAQQFLKTQTPQLSYYLDNLHAGFGLPDQGELALTDKCVDYLQAIGPAGAEFAQNTESRAEELLVKKYAGDTVDGALDAFTVSLHGQPLTRGSSIFSAWKLQRVRDVYAKLDAEQRIQASALAAEIGWLKFLDNPPNYQLERVNHLTLLM